MVEGEALCTVYGLKTSFEMFWREAEQLRIKDL
jgi:hypothetical protein